MEHLRKIVGDRQLDKSFRLEKQPVLEEVIVNPDFEKVVNPDDEKVILSEMFKNLLQHLFLLSCKVLLTHLMHFQLTRILL